MAPVLGYASPLDFFPHHYKFKINQKVPLMIWMSG
jgi:hypothetical protein